LGKGFQINQKGQMRFTMKRTVKIRENHNKTYLEDNILKEEKRILWRRTFLKYRKLSGRKAIKSQLKPKQEK
jgi:hypothetical protein